MELRRTFTEGDVVYLANLCHDCQTCYQACPYTPPHEYAINLPRLLAAVREQSYAAHGWPPWLDRLLRLPLAGVIALAFAAATLFAVLMLATGRIDTVWSQQAGPGSFYRVVPFLAMVVPALALGIFVLVALIRGGVAFVITIRGGGAALTRSSAWHALADVLQMRYMRGGGDGCTYPTGRPSWGRFVMHSLVFYGFLADIASTASAAFQQDVLGMQPPFAILSVPVILGTAGGVAIVIGVAGLLLLKRKSDPKLAAPSMIRLDNAFLAALGLTSGTGLLLLAARDTPAMGALMLIHLAFVAALFVTIPFGKFSHAVYRYVALVQHRAEQAALEVES